MPIGNVVPVTGGQTSAMTSQTNVQLTGNDFMTLLVAQIKAQDPMNPMKAATKPNGKALIPFTEDADTSILSEF